MSADHTRRAGDSLPTRSRSADHLDQAATEHLLGWRDYNMGIPEPRHMSKDYADGRAEARNHAIHEVCSRIAEPRLSERVVLETNYELEPMVDGPAKPRMTTRIANLRESKHRFAGFLCAIGAAVAALGKKVA